MRARKNFLTAVFTLLFVMNACSSSTSTLSPQNQPTAPAATRRATAVRILTSLPPNAKPSPTTLADARQIPKTHVRRTECLTCHEFGTVGPPMPMFHKQDKYDNSTCKRCHQGP